MCYLFQSDDMFAPQATDVEFFEVELVKGTQGLGITIAGYVGEKSAGMLTTHLVYIHVVYQS